VDNSAAQESFMAKICAAGRENVWLFPGRNWREMDIAENSDPNGGKADASLQL
jgi:hypothetical protein